MNLTNILFKMSKADSNNDCDFSSTSSTENFIENKLKYLQNSSEISKTHQEYRELQNEIINKAFNNAKKKICIEFCEALIKVSQDMLKNKNLFGTIIMDNNPYIHSEDTKYGEIRYEFNTALIVFSDLISSFQKILEKKGFVLIKDETPFNSPKLEFKLKVKEFDY